jgi:tetratricopeptide (TPR) repeat protein/DNA-binding CsgD family transcriptional regulator
VSDFSLFLRGMRTLKKANPAKNVSVGTLEARVKRAVRPKEQLWATIRLAEALWDKNATKTEQALALYTKAEQLAETISDRRGIAAAIHGAGSCQLSLSNLPASLELLGRALPIAEQTGDAECEIKILRDLGHLYGRQGRNDLALTTLAKCAELAELMGNIQVQASALDRMGSALMSLGRYQESLECYRKSLTLFEQVGWIRGQVATLLNMSSTLWFLGKWTEAFSALERGGQLSHAIQNPRSEALCQLNIGMFYHQVGDYPNALSNLFAAATILERVGDKLNLAATYGNLMQVYLRLENTEQGKDFGDKALKVYQEIGDKRGQIVMLGSFGSYYLDQRQVTQAKRLLKECLLLSREIGSKDYETEALAALANIDINRGKFDAAEKLYRNALTIASECSDPLRVVTVLLGLGNLFQRQNQIDQAIPFLERAIIVAKEIHASRHEQEAHQILTEALEAKGDFEGALMHSKLASSIEKEILSAEKQKAIAELQIRSDIEKSEKEKTLLKTEAESKSRDIERMVMVLAGKVEKDRSIGRQIREIVKSWDSMVARNGTSHASTPPAHQLDKLLSELERDPTQTKGTIFHNEFQIVHRDILQKLSKCYPTLTLTERKICVLIREQLSDKELSNMLKTSTRTIEVHRYRIRKKMKLERKANLTSVLAGM